jgi:hypothetical protein
VGETLPVSITSFHDTWLGSGNPITDDSLFLPIPPNEDWMGGEVDTTMTRGQVILELFYSTSLSPSFSRLLWRITTA